MFLFLSKLLPLFIYPLGLACVCLVVAIALLLVGQKRSTQRRQRLVVTLISLALLLLYLGGNGSVATALTASLENQYARYNTLDSLPQADAIVVLGGATGAKVPPRILPNLNEASDRMVHGLKLYQLGKAPKIILSGGRIQWAASAIQQPSEAEDMAELLRLWGMPQEALILEPDSLNTRQNAVNVAQILQAQNLNKILLVTSAAHMPRALAIFQKLAIDAVPAPTDFLVETEPADPTQPRARFNLPEILLGNLPASENLYRTSRVIKEYIGTFVYWLRGWL